MSRENTQAVLKSLTIAIAAMFLIISLQAIQWQDHDKCMSANALNEGEVSDTRSPIDFEGPEYTIDASQYEFPIDLSEVSHLERILQCYPINASQREYLENNGFVNLGPSSIYEDSGYYDLVTVYKDVKEIGLAPHITTDAMLHVYHVFFDEILKTIEEEHFFELLKNMTLTLIDATNSQVNNATSTTIDITHVYEADSVYGPVNYTITETISLKKAGERNLEFLYVALKILDPTAVIPSYLRQNVNAELDLIKANEGFAKSPIFDQSDVDGILTYIEDYSQYKPRGHYTRSELLKKYFNAMMWYGRMSFRMKSALETVQAIMLSEALMMKPSTTVVGAVPAITTWDEIYQVTSFFVGKSDDLTPYDYYLLTAQVFGGTGSDYSKLLNVKRILLYLDKLEELRKPRICSSFVRADIEDIENATMGMRLMGQRLVPDSYMFQSLVFPKVGAYEGTGTPFTLSEIIGWGPGKGFPRGLEAMAVLGNDIAEDFLIRDGDVEYAGYDKQYGMLKAEFSDINESTWESNLYWGWLYALDSLNENFTASNYPTYMRNRGYLAQKLNTNLGSWTELRHDTILYAKQSYSPTCGMSYPVGYVEPIPSLYSRLSDLTNATKENLLDLDLISDSTANDLDDFMDMLEKLQDFSERELKNLPLNESEYDYIKMFGWRLEDLLKNVPEDAGDSRLVADVHTDPNIDPSDGVPGKVLEEAVGNFDIMVVIWNDTTENDDGVLRASLGPIFSYYEFKQPMSERLTDEEWRGILENDTEVPEQFDWQDYPRDYPSLVDQSEYYDLWVSTEEIYFQELDEEEDVVRIQSIIHNRGGVDRDATVRMYLGTVEDGSVIQTFDITVSGSGPSTTMIRYDWDITNTEKVIHRIYVEVSTEDENDYKEHNDLAMGFVDLMNVSGSIPDRDGDGVLNTIDAFPDDPAASIDTDGDGHPDSWNVGMGEEDSTTGLKLDLFPNDPFEWLDSDQDGVGDNADMFPLDPYEWSDLDGDNVGDNSDRFPDDPAASIDSDEDGYPNYWNEGMSEEDSTAGLKLDMFPEDPTEWMDSDLDGVGDNSDAFPDDPAASIDTDGDGYPDSWNPGMSAADSTTGLLLDDYPNDPKESVDSDGDLVPDRIDAFPQDPLEWEDSDLDGVGDNSDAFPNDPAASLDRDGDGYPDRWNKGMDEDDSTTGLKIDQYPDDPNRWDSHSVNEDGVDIHVIIVIAILLCIIAFVLIAVIVRKRSSTSASERLSRYWDDVVNDRIPEEERLQDEEMEQLLDERLQDEYISIGTYREIVNTHLDDEY